MAAYTSESDVLADGYAKLTSAGSFRYEKFTGDGMIEVSVSVSATSAQIAAAAESVKTHRVACGRKA